MTPGSRIYFGSSGSGTPGTPGAKWYTGAGVPAAILGNIGDFYLNSLNADYYEKTGAAIWTLQGNLSGLNNQSHFGSGIPAGVLGIVNDVYFDVTNKLIYKKTGLLTWTLQSTYIDTTLRYGNVIPAGVLGIIGDSYLDTSSLNIYLKTGAVTWTLQCNLGGSNMIISNSLNLTGSVPASSVSAALYTVPANRFAIATIASKDYTVSGFPFGVNSSPCQIFIDNKAIFSQTGLGTLQNTLPILTAGSVIKVANNDAGSAQSYTLCIIEFSN